MSNRIASGGVLVVCVTAALSCWAASEKEHVFNAPAASLFEAGVRSAGKLYIRPPAVRAGVLRQDDPRRFGFHNLRHSLASFLIRTKTDPKTVQALLRHSDVRTTLQLYAHSVTEDRLAAQGEVLQAILATRPPANC